MPSDTEIDRHVLRKYEQGAKIGEGAYGIVWKATRKKTRETVALKKIFDAFQNATDAQRTFREIMFLQELGDHDNIIQLQDVMKAENDKDIYLIFEYMETDLHKVIKANLLQDIHKQYIIYQLLKCLKYMHSGNVLHRDLKPGNILLNADCLVKVADFGLARSIDHLEKHGEELPVLTDYIATRWYRAPEILLGSTTYTKGVDIWSVGCIMAELFGGKPIFPGSSTLNQLDKIIEITGRPSSEDIEGVRSPFASTILESLPPSTPRSLADLYPKASPESLDLLSKLLMFNPAKRITAEEALAHPFLKKFHKPEAEIVVGKSITIPFDDNTKFSVTDYRETLYEEIKRARKEKRQQRKERRAQRKSALKGGGASSSEASSSAAAAATGEDGEKKEKKHKKKSSSGGSARKGKAKTPSSN
ncbi:Mitogen-activated protein kinase [Balamuthia mandrillaris]